MSKTKAALLGTGFIANIHAESYARFVHDAEVVAVYGRDKAHAEAFAAAHGIPAAYGDIDELLAAEQVDVVDICLPNYLHHDACLKAAGANKHVIIEKPLALTLEQADEMIEACRSRGLKLMYAEELCLPPNTSGCAPWWKRARWATCTCSSRPKSTAAPTAAGSIRKRPPAAA